MKEVTEFTDSVRTSIDNQSFAKITLSKPSKQAGALQNVYVRLALIKDTPNLSFTYRYKTNDQTKNFSFTDGLSELTTLITNQFQNATLFTTLGDVLFRVSKKGQPTITKSKASITDKPDATHDRQKIKRATIHDAYLVALGVVDAHGIVIPKMADKYRQINKYLEVIESLIKETQLPKRINIVDMGSGKGYLTFALYDYLKNKQNVDVAVTGIELRKELVDFCNTTAQQCGFTELKFEQGAIEEFQNKEADIVIALHACDTATDDAIAKAINANATIIVCAPCCHKQIRQQVKGKEQFSPLMKYGIFKERQFEMVTDTIRALILEKQQYDTKIFEFVSNEHTRKNILLVASKSQKPNAGELIDEKISSLKNAYQIDFHYLEKLIG